MLLTVGSRNTSHPPKGEAVRDLMEGDLLQGRKNWGTGIRTRFSVLYILPSLLGFLLSQLARW